MPSPDSVVLVFTSLALVLLIAGLSRPIYGLLGYTIIMMLRPGLRFPIMADFRVELLAGIYVLLLAVLKRRFFSRIFPTEDPILAWFWSFLLVVLISMVFAFDFSASWAWVYEFFKVVFLLVTVVSLAETQGDVRWVLWTLCLCTTSVAYDAIYNFVNGIVIDNSSARAVYSVASSGMGSGHVALANILLQSLPLLWYVGIQSAPKIIKPLGIAILALDIYGVLISGSRGGFIGLIAFLGFTAAFSERRWPFVLAGAAVLFGAPILMGERYSNYMATLLALDLKGGTGSDRFLGLRNGFEMLLRRPLLGVGPGCYPLARKAWMGWGLWAHNLYGELMGDLGLAGCITWGGLIKSYLSRALNLRKKTDPATRSVLLGIVVATFIRLIEGLGSHSTYLYFWYLMAALVVTISRNQSGEADESHLPDPTVEPSLARE